MRDPARRARDNASAGSATASAGIPVASAAIFARSAAAYARGLAAVVQTIPKGKKVRAPVSYHVNKEKSSFSLEKLKKKHVKKIEK